jgi:membrane protease subunit HflK
VLYEQRDAVAAELVKSIQSQLDRLKTGVIIVNVNLQSVQPPEQVQAAFDDAVKAGQDGDRLKKEGLAYASDVIPKAGGTASRLEQEAAGYRQRVIASAEGDASRFKQVLAEYSKAPAVTRERIYIETLQQILSTTSKVMMDYKGGGNLLYLPLDKLMQQAGTLQLPEGAAPRAPGPEPAAAAPEPAQRSREALRGRERGER